MIIYISHVALCATRPQRYNPSQNSIVKEVYLLKISLRRLLIAALSFEKPVYQTHGEIESKDAELFFSRREEFRERYLPKNESERAGTEATTEEDGAQVLPHTQN